MKVKHIRTLTQDKNVTEVLVKGGIVIHEVTSLKLIEIEEDEILVIQRTTRTGRVWQTMVEATEVGGFSIG